MPATPTYVQGASGSNSGSATLTSYTVVLPNLTLTGNCLIVGTEYGDGGSATSVTDDATGGTNTYVQAISHDDTTDGQKLDIWVCTNCKAGARSVTVNFSGGPGFVSACAYEFYNVSQAAVASALDGTTGHDASSASITAGSFTPTTSGDLLFQYGAQLAGFVPITFTQGTSPWAFLNCDQAGSIATQYQVQTTAAAINPTFTQGSAKRFASVACALKASSSAAGTAPSAGMRVVNIQHQDFVASFGTATLTLKMPSTGNLLVACWSAPFDYKINSITDGNSNTWVDNGSGIIVDSGSDVLEQCYYAGNATSATNLVVTIHANEATPSGGGSDVLFYDIAGAATSPLDVHGSAIGDQTSVGNITGATIVPTTANGVIVSFIGVVSDTITGINSPGLFDSGATNPILAISPVDNNAGFAHEYNATSGSRTYTWQMTDNEGTGGVGNWSSLAVAFKAPTGGGGIPFEDDSFNPSTLALLVTQSDPIISVW